MLKTMVKKNKQPNSKLDQNTRDLRLDQKQLIMSDLKLSVVEQVLMLDGKIIPELKANNSRGLMALSL